MYIVIDSQGVIYSTHRSIDKATTGAQAYTQANGQPHAIVDSNTNNIITITED